MKVVSIINYKGGVGKTTITANLAADLASRHNKRVLAMDIDSQSNLTFSFMDVAMWLKLYCETNTIKNWFDAVISGGPVPSFSDLIIQKHEVDILCSHLHLIHVDFELGSTVRGTTSKLYKQNFVKSHSLIKDELNKLRDSYDVVLIDCPPNLGTVTKNALVASDFYLVPFKADFLSTVGVDVLMNHIKSFVADYNLCCAEIDNHNNIAPNILGGVATMFDIYAGAPTNVAKNFIGMLKNAVEIPLFDIGLRENKSFYGSAEGMPVVLLKPQTATDQIILEEIHGLTDEFAQKAGI